jgi:hypothetical protein
MLMLQPMLKPILSISPASNIGRAKYHRRAARELAEEVQGTTPLPPAPPPHRQQGRLRSHLAQEGPEAGHQLRRSAAPGPG